MVARLVGRRTSSPASFPTTWPNTENPVSQGSIWTQGGDVGLDWNNVQSIGGSPGLACGTTFSSSSSFDDNIATLQGQGFSTTKHYVQIRLKVVAGYNPSFSHETEALGLFTIGAHSAKGYEVTFSMGNQVVVARWNGAVGDFNTDVFTTVSGATFNHATGDVMKIIYDSSSGSPVITMIQNTVTKWVVTDTTAGKITSGFPGMGDFILSGGGTDVTKYGNDSFDAGNA